MALAAAWEGVEGLEKLIELEATWKKEGKKFFPDESSWPTTPRNTFGSMSQTSTTFSDPTGSGIAFSTTKISRPKSLSRKTGNPAMPKRPRSSGQFASVVSRERSKFVKLGGVPRPRNGQRSGAFMGSGAVKGTLSHPGELKYLDKDLNVSIDATGEIISSDFLDIPQGTAQKQRIGNKAWISKLMFKGKMTFTPTTTLAGTAPIVTVYVVLDKQANKLLPSVTDVFTSTALSVALHNLDNSQRFRVLHKIEIPFNVAAGSTDAWAQVSVPVNFFLGFEKNPIQIDYTGANGTFDERTINSMVIMAQSAGADDLVSMVGTLRIRYRD